MVSRNDGKISQGNVITEVYLMIRNLIRKVALNKNQWEMAGQSLTLGAPLTVVKSLCWR